MKAKEATLRDSTALEAIQKKTGRNYYLTRKSSIGIKESESGPTMNACVHQI